MRAIHMLLPFSYNLLPVFRVCFWLHGSGIRLEKRKHFAKRGLIAYTPSRLTDGFFNPTIDLLSNDGKKEYYLVSKNTYFVWVLVLQGLIFLLPVFSETIPFEVQEILTKGPESCEPTDEEILLYRLLMAYRVENGKPEIPLSRSLTYVAQLHVRDLAANKVTPPYTLHSWSKNGPWEGVRYTANHRQARLMWNKPKELTNYPGDGFEITFSKKGGATAKSAYLSWKDQRSISSIILNTGNWETIRWRAVGVGIHDDYAVLWFGDRDDTE